MNFRDFFADSREDSVDKPFPWQQALWEHILSEGGWPNALSMGTGLGKTATIDIALYHIAHEVERGRKGIEEREAPLRIVYTIDRRTVIDQTYERAMSLLESLRNPDSPVLKRVADNLHQLHGEDDPFHVTRLRGAIHRDEKEMPPPVQPAIILSTVDQAGSRLAFRGYGSGNLHSPIGAGLIGMDSLLIIDEAHISRPFWNLLDEVESYREEHNQEMLDAPFDRMAMSATLPPDRFSRYLGDDSKQKEWYTEEVKKQDRKNPTLRKRIESKIDVSVSEIDTKVRENADSCREKLRSAILDHTRSKISEFEEHDDIRSDIGVVVNRTRDARRLYEELSDSEDCRVHLLTGRFREKERQEALRRIKESGEGGEVHVIVATQTVEVGFDHSFDHLVSEIAPIDALIQRLGRLDRYGEVFDKLGQYPKAHIFAHNRQTYGEQYHRGNLKDPVYDMYFDGVFDWLESQDVVSLHEGIDSLEIDWDQAQAMLPDQEEMPCLNESVIEDWAETSIFYADRMGPFLHGIDQERRPDDVHVVWREDLSEQLDQTSTDKVRKTPPSTKESLRIPIWAFERWMENERWGIGLSDVNAAGSPQEEETDKEKREREWGSNRGPRVIRFDYGEDEEDRAEIIRAEDVGPGDTVVLPSSYGGYDEAGFDPKSEDPVEDCFEASKRFEIIRCHPSLFENESEEEQDLGWISDLVSYLKEGRVGEKKAWRQYVDKEHVRSYLEYQDWSDSDIDSALSKFAGDGPDEEGKVRHTNVDRYGEEGAIFYLYEFEESTHSRLLENHCRDVERKARQWVEYLGLPEPLADAVVLAAKYHDIGKCDPRFQAWLSGGIRPMFENLVAKSYQSIGEMIRARKKSGYPKGARHEWLSMKILEDNLDHIADKVEDPALLLHLVGSHHGHGRPVFPPVEDSGESSFYEPEDIQIFGLDIDNDMSYGQSEGGVCYEDQASFREGNFREIARKYGQWTTAFLESLVRLADHEMS